MHKSTSLLVGLFFLFVTFLSCEGGSPETAATQPETTTPTTLKAKLKDQFYLGAAVGKAQIEQGSPATTELIKREFNTLTPENDMKWENIHPERDGYNFVTSDRYVDLAESSDMHVVGHALVWHSQLAPYVTEITDSSELATHITNTSPRL